MNPVIQRFARTYTFRRFGPGNYAGDGSWLVGPEVQGSPFSFVASIQPLNARERLLLPEGEREQDTVRIYTEALLQVVQQLDGSGQAGKTKGDLVQYNGRDWEIFKREDWTATRYPFFKYLAHLVEVDT